MGLMTTFVPLKTDGDSRDQDSKTCGREDRGLLIGQELRHRVLIPRPHLASEALPARLVPPPASGYHGFRLGSKREMRLPGSFAERGETVWVRPGALVSVRVGPSRWEETPTAERLDRTDLAEERRADDCGTG